MSRTLEQVFSGNKNVFVPYMTAGDPNFSASKEIVKTLVAQGAGIIELGIPFSDSAADGEINQRSFARAIANGFTFEKLFHFIEELRFEGIDTPFILFGHLNPFLQYGIEKLAAISQKLGVRGVLIVDLPLESAGEIKKIFMENEIHLVNLVAPTTSDERMEFIGKNSSGMIYCIARAGVTGRETMISEEMKLYLEKVRIYAGATPLVVGFGLCQKEQIDQLAPYCDGHVIGSAIVQKIEDGKGEVENIKSNLNQFLQRIKSCL